MDRQGDTTKEMFRGEGVGALHVPTQHGLAKE
jgi:hypothetical protein